MQKRHKNNGTTFPTIGDVAVIEEQRITNMADAMEMAMQSARVVDDEDPDPYGYGQELEAAIGVNVLAPQWKAVPDDTRWVKRLKGRARKTAVARMFLLGHSVPEIAAEVKTTEITVYRDLNNISMEWRRTYLADIEELAGKDLARLDYMLSKLAKGIDSGDPKSINTAIEIIKERGSILGYRQGVQIDIEQMVREVAEANGYDPDKAVMMASRISISMRGT